MIDFLKLVLAMVGAAVFGVVLVNVSRRCPPKWWLSRGVGPAGEYRCSAPLEAGCEDARSAGDRVPCRDPARYDSRIWCTGGSHPIVVDSNAVGCQR